MRREYAAIELRAWITTDCPEFQSGDDLMTEAIKTWRADPLAWGLGPRQFEMFLEPTWVRPERELCSRIP